MDNEYRRIGFEGKSKSVCVKPNSVDWFVGQENWRENKHKKTKETVVFCGFDWYGT